jgi:hypothetical protein
LREGRSCRRRRGRGRGRGRRGRRGFIAQVFKSAGTINLNGIVVLLGFPRNAKPVQDKCTKTHVGDDKVFRETYYLTSRVEAVELPSAIRNNSDPLPDGLLCIIYYKNLRHITGMCIKARNNLLQCCS